ncbi:hypothetical protein ACFE04_006895 [Oxalis oulophora]
MSLLQLQEASGFFFCLEDRALLCRKCDVAIHTANVYVSGHQRFLLTGVKVGLEATEPGSSSSAAKSSSGDKVSAPSPPPMARRSPQMPMANEYNEILPAQAQIGNDLDFSSMRLPYAGGSTAGSTPQWHIDDFLGFSDIGQQYGYTDNGSSKLLFLVEAKNSIVSDFNPVSICVSRHADSRGDSDSSYILRSAKEDLEDDECVGQVPESSWAVPQIPSPPTASGLNWTKNFQTRHDISFSVPDIYNSSSVQNSPQSRHSGTKRGRRQI